MGTKTESVSPSMLITKAALVEVFKEWVKPPITRKGANWKDPEYPQEAADWMWNELGNLAVNRNK